MMLAPDCAAPRSAASAASTAASSRPCRQASSRAICSASTAGSTVRIAPSPAVSGEASPSVPAVDADDHRLARLDPRQPLGICLDQPALHVVDRRDRAAHRVERRQFGPCALLQCRDLRRRPPDCRRKDRRIPEGRSHRRGSAASAATIADPRAAAGRAPRSRPAAAPRGRGRSSTASPPASREGCGRRCFPAAARSARGELTCTP